MLALVTLALAIALVVVVRRKADAPPAVDREALESERRELATTRVRLGEREDRLVLREERVTELASGLQRDREKLDAERSSLDDARSQLGELSANASRELERIAGLDAEAARAEVLAAAEKSARREGQRRAKQIIDDSTADAELLAAKVVTTAVERVASRQVGDSVVSAVELPGEDWKGRIIGREGRNIRAFEQVSGVSLVVDDTPGLVLLSCFDPVRREIARRTLIELVADGRIDPARIEEAHAAASDEVEQLCIRAAQDAIDELGLAAPDAALLPIIGALSFRTSYGQNVLEHSIECAELAGAMAAEIGLDVESARRAAFLHDLGKAVITHGEGSHATEGADLARAHGEPEEVVHAIAAHHNEIEATSPLDVLTQAADAISGSRPGARRESVEAYHRRLTALEEIATRRTGVEKAFALQAGREVRVMVVPEEIDDTECHELARGIADDIERELTVPGRVKVTVIRESRATEIAS